MKHAPTAMEKMRRVLFRIIPDCEEAIGRLWMRGRHAMLAWPQRLGLRVHLAVCPRCREYEKTLNWVTDTLAQSTRAPTFDGRYKISPEQRARIEKFIREQGPADEPS